MSKRYICKQEGTDVLVKCLKDSWLGMEGTTQQYRSVGGYVHEVYGNGNMVQTYDAKGPRGSTLMSSEENLLETMREQCRTTLKDQRKWEDKL